MPHTRLTHHRLALRNAAAILLAISALAASAAAQPTTPETTPTPATTQANADPAATPAAAPLLVVVSIPPLKGLIEPLLPAGSTVELLVPAGVSEHGYEIPPAKLAAVARADLVVYVGMGMEPQIDKALTKPGKAGRAIIRFEDVPAVKALITPDAGQTDQKTKTDHTAHAHDAEGRCIHEGDDDPHVWLDPTLALALVTHVNEHLAARQLPTNATPAAVRALAATNAGAAKLERRLLDLHARYTRELAAPKTKTIVVAHDAYGWLARRYGLTVIPVSGLTASEPKADDIRRAARVIQEQRLSTIFIEPQLSPAAANRIAQLTGCKVDTLDPLGDGDYLALMNRNLAALTRALSPAPSPTQPTPSTNPAPAKP